ncbi:hypothetical protein [Thermococcus sp. 9N3]|uniref:hypothetical protein n=1 Tax=Thermococcus sp. 9N3 TaxID=163002 RepID=UPI00143006BB|nr:hypothetical protein [Thermococcus sp. 9N3]
MRRGVLLLALLLSLPWVSAWNATFQFHPSHGQELDDILINYTSECSSWVFGTFDDGSLVQDFAFPVNGSGSVDLQDYLNMGVPSNSTLYLESNCELNVTVHPRYGIYMHPPEVRALSTEFRLVKIPFKKTGEGRFEIETPWKLVAVYLESHTVYDNGTYVSNLPLRVEVSWENQSVLKTPEGRGTYYWVDVSDWKPRGRVILKLSGRRAKYIDSAYGYALVPHREKRQWWLVYNYKEGYYFGDGRPWREILIKLEFLWKGEDFTLASFVTQDEEKLSLKVEGGRVCLEGPHLKKCGSRIPRGALKLTVGFQSGYLWVLGGGNVYFNEYTGTEAAALINLLWGVPKDDRYSVEIHAKNSSYWKPKKRMEIGLAEILGGSALVISLLALYLSRKH